MSPKTKIKTSFTAAVTLKVSPELKRRIEQIVLEKKILDKAGLPPRWGVSDYLREIIENYLKNNPAG